jgi:hypothetical protein
MASSSSNNNNNPAATAAINPVRPEIFVIELEGLPGSLSATSTLVPNSPASPAAPAAPAAAAADDSAATPTQSKQKQPMTAAVTSPSSSSSEIFVPKLHNSYLPDSVISGKVFLKLRQALRVKTLRVNLYGIEYVRFTQTSPQKDGNRQVVLNI